MPRHPLLPAPHPPPRRFRDWRPRLRKARHPRLYPRALLDPGHVQALAAAPARRLGRDARRGFVHRDLRVDNLLFREGGKRLVVCDLEGRWGQRVAPEVAWEGSLEDSGWSERSDVYDVGVCIKGMVYVNAPITHPACRLTAGPDPKTNRQPRGSRLQDRGYN